MGMFDKDSGMNEVPTGSSRLFFLPGTYEVRVDAVKSIDAKDSEQNKNSFIVECTVIKSTNPARPAGSSPSWVQSIKPGAGVQEQRQQKLAWQNIKQFLAAAIGDMAYFDKPDESGNVPLATEVGELACSDANPFGGTLIGLTCTNKPLRDGSDFTKHDWSPHVAAAAPAKK